MNLSRRSLLIAAPAVILTPHLLMPVKPWFVTPQMFGATIPDSLAWNELIIRFFDTATDELLKVEVVEATSKCTTSYFADKFRSIRADVTTPGGKRTEVRNSFGGTVNTLVLGDILRVDILGTLA